MPQTIEVRFKGIRRDFFLWPDAHDPLRLSEAVIVQAERGLDFGRVHTAGAAAEAKCGTSCGGCDRGTADKTPLVATGEAGEAFPGADPVPSEAPEPAEPAEPAEPPSRRAAESSTLRPVLRRANPDEIRAADDLRRQEEEARRQVAEKIRHHKLEMKASDLEWQWDRSKLTVFFTAEKRVDFRALVRDLAGIFRTRIELRQIGVRDEAARLGGVGRCGREYCCSTWLGELSPVSLALAKDQHLSLNPTQISGGCGRLLCCLKYEHEFYVAARKRFPREGKAIATARGREKVIAVDIFRERVFLRHDEQGSRIIPLLQLREEMETAPSLEALAAQPAPPPPRREARERPGAPSGPRPERPRGEPRPPAPEGRRERPPERPSERPPERGAGRPERRPGREAPGRPPRGDRPATPPAPRPPTAPAPAPAQPQADPAAGGPGDQPRKSRRRRRGRRGGRGPAGESAGPSTPPEA